MKKTTTLLLLSIFTFTVSAQNDFFDKTDTFFKNFVENDKVNYNLIKENQTSLFGLLDHIATNPIPEPDRKAYLINVYNLFVISGIIEAYPIQSTQELPAFYDAKNYVLANEKISLNGLEKELLLKPYGDLGLHFTLVCGALGCPPIIAEAYQTEGLDAKINKRATIALNSDFIKINHADKKVELSQIFSWYASDFGKNKAEVLTYINNFRKDKIPTDYKVSYYDYNWSLNDTKSTVVGDNLSPMVKLDTDGSDNLQAFTAGSLLRKNQFDYTVFNTIYTQTKSDWKGDFSIGDRETFVTHLFQVTYGVSKNKRINIGLDLSLRSSGKSPDKGIKGLSPAFSYKNTPTSRFGLTSIGVRLKLQPFKQVSDFSIQSSISAPIIQSPEGINNELYWADWDRITWWNQLFYIKSFGKFQLFTELDFLFRFKKHQEQIGMLDIPMSVFLSYFPTNKITLYAMTQHVSRLTNDITSLPNPTDWVIPMNYTASGVGGKYQLTRGLNLELLYSNFWRGRSSGLGSTFNIGIKYITK